MSDIKALLISLGSIISIQSLDFLSSIMGLIFQLIIGVLTIIYFIVKIKRLKNDE